MHSAIASLIACRNRLFQAALIGYDAKHDVGYGNVSLRRNESRFYVSGTQTGHLPELDESHFCEVIGHDVEQNAVTCEGPVQASSESMTHAVIYQTDPSVQAIIHVHHHGLWEGLKGVTPTTGEDVPYGTPEMAREVEIAGSLLR